MAGFKITVDGVEIEANSAADVAELLSAMKSANKQPQQAPIAFPQPRQINRRQPRQNDVVIASRHKGMVMNLLNGLASRTEIDSHDMQRILEVNEPKGVGAKFKVINPVIEELGFNKEDVYVTTRDRDGRTWTAGPKLAEAIKAIKG